MNPQAPDQSRADVIVGLRGISQNNRLWTGLLGLLETNLQIEQISICAPNIPDSEVHRARGRMGILLELREELVRLHAEAHTTE